MPSYLFHRLEWIPSTLLLLLLLSARLSPSSFSSSSSSSQNDLDVLPSSSVFSELNDVNSVQNLVTKRCMTEVRGLCSASYREVDPKCATKTNAGGETFDAPFLSVLDRFTDAATKCSLQLVLSFAQKTPAKKISMKKPKNPLIVNLERGMGVVALISLGLF